MKKGIFAIAIVALLGGMMFTGCKKDSEVVRLKAQIERVGGDSKVWLNDNDAPQFFQSGEYVKINDNDPLEIQYSNGTCTLSPATANNYYAVYPASIVTDETITGTTVNVKLPHLQNYVEDATTHRQKINLPSGAVSSGTSLRFYNLCSLIEVQCTIPSDATGTYTISSIEVTAKDKGLWGEGTATLDGTSSSINIPYNGHNSRVVLEIPNATAISAGQSTGKYYIVVPPYSGSTEFTVKVRFNQGGSSFTATKTGAVLERNIIVELNRTQKPEEDTELSGYFTIKNPTTPNGTDGMKVVFSKGNLQHRGAVNNVASSTWHFADNQYDYYGTENIASYAPSNEAAALSTTVDMFCMSLDAEYRDGYSGNVASPHSYGLRAPASEEDYAYNLTNGFLDWGSLVIDGDPAGTWFTMTDDEWNCLFNSRPNARNLRANVVITGVSGHPTGASTIQGFMLFPDDWTRDDIPSGITLNGDGNNNVVNQISVANFKRLEAAGAIFLPAAGYRYSEPGDDYPDVITSQNSGYLVGYYWSSTIDLNNLDAKYVNYQLTTSSYTFVRTVSSSDGSIHYGMSVRLVKPAPGYTISGRANN